MATKAKNGELLLTVVDEIPAMHRGGAGRESTITAPALEALTKLKAGTTVLVWQGDRVTMTGRRNGLIAAAEEAGFKCNVITRTVSPGTVGVFVTIGEPQRRSKPRKAS